MACLWRRPSEEGEDVDDDEDDGNDDDDDDDDDNDDDDEEAEATFTRTRFHIDTVSRLRNRFKNVPLLAAFSNRPGFANGLDQCRVNRRHNRIENDAVTNQTAFE